MAWYWARRAKIRGVGPEGRWFSVLSDSGRRRRARRRGGRSEVYRKVDRMNDYEPHPN